MLHVPVKLVIKILVTYRYRITFRRLFNLTLVFLSMAISKVLNHPVTWGYPLILMVEPTNLCNLKCPMCPSGAGIMKRSRGKMDIKKFKRLIDEIGGHLILVQFWNQGEPFIHTGLSEMVSYVKSKHVPAMTSTNGHFFQTRQQVASIVQSGIDEIIVSFDGVDQTTYEQYRVGGQFDKVIGGVKNLVQYKQNRRIKRPLINMQFLVLKHNEDQIEKIKTMGRKLGVDLVTLKSAQIYSDEQGLAYLPDDDRFRRYTYNGKTHQMKSRFPDWCQLIWTVGVVNWDGSITPCCFDKDGEYRVGNTFQEGVIFKRLWKGDRFQAFRKKVLHDRSSIPICTNCFEGIRQPYVYYHVL
jgi:radical SAM protein with 4Fe4S-binding SPASM domain